MKSFSSFFKTFFIVTALVTYSTSIFIETVSVVPKCFHKFVAKDEEFSGDFVVSGYFEDNIIVMVIFIFINVLNFLTDKRRS